MSFGCSEYQRYNFWKQFTTVRCIYPCNCQLFRISKIQFFESNSQHIATCTQLDYRLFRISKIQFFESNSQPLLSWVIASSVVQNIKRYNFLKAIHNLVANPLANPLLLEYQRYNFLKAIHNVSYTKLSLETVVQNIKDTIFWKQFTTKCLRFIGVWMLFRISKIQFFESNSQL